jgi:dipeptidyl aminopeptidase/acylaminoacyl peptidase
MILGHDVAVAIEANFREPRHESVETWLGVARATNRREVLEGWIRAIEDATEAAVDREVVRKLPYQLIHRTASVCCLSRRKRVVVYQVFGDAPGPYYAQGAWWAAFTQLVLLDIAARRERPLTTSASHKCDATWSPDGRWVAFATNSDGGINVWSIPAGGGGEQPLTSGRKRIRHFYYSLVLSFT